MQQTFVAGALLINCLLSACASSPLSSNRTLSPDLSKSEWRNKAALVNDASPELKESRDTKARTRTDSFAYNQISHSSGESTSPAPRTNEIASVVNVEVSADSQNLLNSREFGTPVVGSAQWNQEQAEDARREKEIKRKMRICNC